MAVCDAPGYDCLLLVGMCVFNPRRNPFLSLTKKFQMPVSESKTRQSG